MAAKRQDAPGELEHVRAFVNTLDLEAGKESLVSAAALSAWLAEHGLASRGVRATGEDLVRAVALREALRESLRANSGEGPAPPGACRTLDEATRRARLHPRLLADGTSEMAVGARGVDGALGRLLAIVHRSASEGTWPRLKACRLPSCGWAFYDHTKNRSGSWCTMAVCGNRAKSRAYRARHQAAAPSREL